MIRKGLLAMGLFTTLLFFAGCHSYSYLRGSVGYGEASTVPYSEEYYAYAEPPYYYYPGPSYYYGYPYPPYYYYPYPYFFRGYFLFHSHPNRPAAPSPGRRLRSLSGGDSSTSSSSSTPSSDDSSSGGRRLKK
jgi:hypothetical protein